MRTEHNWVVIGTWPADRARPYINIRMAHLWTTLAVACQREDYGLVHHAPDQTPRCAICVRILIGS
jgi:hypothetical protein